MSRLLNGRYTFDPEVFASAETDAFGRQRISEAQTLLDSQSQYDKQPLVFAEKTANGGALVHDPNASSVLMSTTTASGSLAMRQSRQYIAYQPGKSQLAFITFTLATPQANLKQEIGYGDDRNGIFLLVEGTNFYLVQRNSTSGVPVDKRVARADWNLDTFDGFTPSRLTLDFAQSQILVIDLEWLGVGLVRVGFNIAGRTYYAHGFQHANEAPSVYMVTANLPVRWKIENLGATATPSTLRAICCSVMSEAGFENMRALPFSITTPVAGVGSVGTTERAILALRPRLLFKGQINRITLLLEEYYGVAFDAAVVLRLRINPTVTGGNWVVVDAESTAEFNASATSFSGGILISSAAIAAQSTGGNRPPSAAAGGIFSELSLTLDIDGTVADVILLTAQRIGPSGTATVFAGFEWREQR